MTSRSRKEQDHFDLQPDALSRNGHGEHSGVGYASPDEVASAPDIDPPAPHEAAQPASASASPGKIEVSQRAIAHVASRAAQRSYGVVGLASRHARPGWGELLRREEAHKGVTVTFSGGRVIIDLYVVIEYGTRISEVARNIMSNVKFAVESALDVSGAMVNINVQDIRVSEDEHAR